MKRFLIAIFALTLAFAANAQTASRGTPRTTATATQATAVTGRSGTTQIAAPNRPTVTARAGMIGAAASLPVMAPTTGTTAAQNSTATAQNTIASLVNPACKTKFDNCMNQFCDLQDGISGTCACSNRYTELESAKAELFTLRDQINQMNTVGVERLQLGANADYVFSAAESQSLLTANRNNATAQRTQGGINLDDLWGDNPFATTDDAFSVSTTVDALATKRGDALYTEVFNLCRSQISECMSDSRMLQLLYSQQIQRDCRAYENNLTAQKRTAQSELSKAQANLRNAALESFQTANKYNLGECTVAFKQCMATTGGCGADFTGCVGTVASENAALGRGVTSATKNYKINGAIKGAYIEVALSTIDTLEAKRPLCERTLESCVAVRDNVWDTFLREVAPTLKSAELTAESNLRTSCIGNISACFQKACRDTMDPNDPDGSYDLCLTRPEALRSMCRVQIDPCEKAEPMIMDFVTARLASMRVDSCTNEFKSCLTDDNRCGADYSNCIGLSTDEIVTLCPADRLVACQRKYGNGTTNVTSSNVYDELYNIAQGVILGIDNAALSACQKAVDDAMVKVCGSTTTCDGISVMQGVGANSLQYQVCRRGVGCSDTFSVSNNMNPEDYTIQIVGQMDWNSVDPNNITVNFAQVLDAGSAANQVIAANANADSTNINGVIKNTIAAVESDARVQFCMNGRQTQDSAGYFGRDSAAAGGRFPKLTEQFKQIIANKAVSEARKNYYDRMSELNDQKAKDLTRLAGVNAKIACEAMSKGKDAVMPSGLSGLEQLVWQASVAANDPNQSTATFKRAVTTSWNEAAHECTKITLTTSCKDTSTWGGLHCVKWGDTEESREVFVM